MRTLDIHVVNGLVYYNEHPSQTSSDNASSSVDARSSGLSVSDFLEAPICHSAECVRALGLVQNVALLLGLYARKQTGQIKSLRVATPLTCHTRRERQSPDCAIMRMEQLDLAAPSVGGFHEFVDSDFQAYAFAAEVTASKVCTGNRVTVSKKALGLLRAHPAWRSISFIQSLNPVYVAGLLAHMMDPRWYIRSLLPRPNWKP